MKLKIDQSQIITTSNPFERFSGSMRYCAYTGRSMHPTLFEADLLEIEQPSRIWVGDVIIFVSKDNLVVHRVVGVALDGFITRGDNNNDEDLGHVPRKKIVGIVAWAWRGQQRRRIYGGQIGQTYKLFLCIRRRLCRKFRSSLTHPYRAASHLGLPRLIELFCRPRIVRFNRNGDIDFSLMLGSHIIGHYCQSRNCWQIHPPFRLLVDEAVLHKAQIDLSRPGEGEAILPCAEMKVE